MKAILYHKYGDPDVLQLKEIPKPTPKNKELLVKLHATTVTSGDVRLRKSDFPPLFWLPARLIFGLFRPKKKILGHEWSGVVEAVGKEVSEYSPGDQVWGTTTMLPAGSYAEYICVPQEWKSGVIGHRPIGLAHEACAAIPIGGMTALYLLDKAGIKANQKVLVYGASGSVGSYAIQIAKDAGCEVTAVCSARNFDMVQSLGADHCIDYKSQDYSALTNSYDIILDAVGKTTKSKAKKVLSPQGRFVTVSSMTSETTDNLERLKKLAESGAIKPYIDRTYPLESVKEAHEYVDTGRKRGNVIIKIH